MALHLKLRSHHSSLLSLRLLSTSSPFPPPPPLSDDPSHDSQSQQLPSFSSLFKSSPSSRIPLNPPPPPSLSEPSVASSEDIRRHLAQFRLRNPSPRSASSPDISFQKLFKDSNNVPVSDAKRSSFNSFDSIRESLRQSQGRNDQVSLNSLQEKLRSQISSPNSAFGTGDPLPESIFGKDARKLKEEEEDTSSRTFFCRSYSEAELGQKLRQLRPEETEKRQFSLTEMNERLAKLRKMEEESSFSGVIYKDLRGSLMRVLEDDKKKNVQRLSLLANLGGLTTPAFMLKPPQEELLEKYFHPDHMSSAEKMKLELQKVRDEFKMSESDCGSARVQVAQLTTKIKHLSGALHKKDKHSRKGLKEMVQKRKKLLKYLRRTDWDSYILVLSKLGLRDVPEYKAPDYKSKNKMKA